MDRSVSEREFGFKSNKPLVAQVPLTSAQKVKIQQDTQKMSDNVKGLTLSNVNPSKPQPSLKKPIIDINESVDNSMAQKEEVTYQKEQEDIKQAKIEEMGAGKASWERTKSTMSTLGKSVIDGVVATSSKQVAILSQTIDNGLESITGNKAKPIDEYATYQFGKAVEEFTGQVFNPNKLFEGETQEQIASTVGDMLGMVAVAIVTKSPTSALGKMGTKGIIKALAGSAVARKQVSKMILKESVKSLTKPVTFVAAAQVGVRNYDEAISKGATEDQANSMYWSTAASGGLLNSLPIGKLLNRFDKASGGKMKQVVVGGLVGGVEESVTEGLEQITTNFAAKNIYDETRTLFEGVGESAGMGGGIGFVFNAFGVSLGKARHKFKNNPEKIAEIDASEQYLKELVEKTAVQSIPVPKELQIKVDKYNEVLNNPNSPQALKDIANNSLLEIQSGLVGSKELEVSGIANLSEDARAEYSIIYAEIKDLEAARGDIDDVELKDRVDESLSELKQKQGELLANAQQPQSEGELGGGGSSTNTESTTYEYKGKQFEISNDETSITEVGSDSPVPIEVIGEVKRNGKLLDSGMQAMSEPGSDVKKAIVYHGGNLDGSGSFGEGNFYLARDKSQANEYAKGNKGSVVSYEVDENTIATEDVAREVLKELGIEANGERNNNLKIHEIIDDRFDTSITEDEFNKLKKELKKRGYDGISFIDEDITQKNKAGVNNVVIFDPKKSLVNVTEKIKLENPLQTLNGEVSTYKIIDSADIFEPFALYENEKLIGKFETKKDAEDNAHKIEKEYSDKSKSDSQPNAVEGTPNSTIPPSNTPPNNGSLPPTVPPPPNVGGELSAGMEPIGSNNDESSATEVDTNRELSDREKQMLTKPEGRSFGRMQVLDKISEKLMAIPAISKTVKMFTTGNKDAIRSKEIVDAEIGITMDKIKSIKNKLSNTIGKSATNRKLANDVISVGNIDDTISKLAYSDSYQALSDIMEGKYTPAEIKAATESFNANNKEGISAIDKAKFEAIVADVSKISPSQIVDKRTSDSAEIKSLAGKIINFDTVGKVKKDNTPSPTVVIGRQSALFPGKATDVASKVSPNTKNSEIKTSKDKVETLEDLRGQLLSKPRGEEILNAIDEALKTKKAAVEKLNKSPLGKKILKASNDARELIDAHQEYLLDSEAAKKIQERIGDTIAGNQGTYLKRTFDMFKDKKYEPSVAQKERAVQSIIDDMMVNELLNLQKSKEYQKTIKAKEAETTKSTEVSTSVDDNPDIGSDAVEVDLNGNEITTTDNESNDVTVEDYRKWSSGREISDVDFYRAEYLKQLYESVERKARIELDTYLDDIRRRKESGPLHQLSQGVQKIDGNSLEMRKVFDPSFVDLLGNVNDPISQFMDTVMAQAQIKAAADLHFMINSVAGIDMIFDSKENLIDLRGSTKGFKEINDKNSLLGGKWVSEDIHDVISSEGGLDIDTWLGGAYKTVLSKMRKTKTIYNPAGWTTNWMGGVITHFANGIVTNPVSFVKNMANRANYITNQKALNKSYADDIQAMKDNGAWSTSVSAETIRILEDKLASMEAYDSFGSSKYKEVINKGKIIDDNIIRNYSVIDDYTKLVFFREKKDIFARKATGKKYADLTKEEKRQVDSNLSERIKQNIATTSRLPRFYREITKLPFGDFMAFRISAIASGKNTMLNAASDLKYAFDKTKSKEQRKAYLEDNLKTTTGFVLSAALNASFYGSIATLAMGLLDDKDEDLFVDKKYNGENIGSKADIYIDFKGTPSVNAQWMRGKNNIPINDDGNGNLELINLSNKDPNDELYGLFVPRAGTTYTETLMGIAKEVAAPNMAVKLFDSILKGTDQWGRDIYSTDDTFLEKRSKQVAYIMTEVLLPPSINNVHKQAISDAVRVKLKKEDISKDEIKDTDIEATEYIGSVIKNSPKLLNRTYDLNISEQLGYYAKEFYKSTPEKFTDLSPEKKRNRIENLKPIREGYLYIQRYSRLHDNPAFLRKATENLFKKSRGITDQEKKYIRTGKLPKFEKNVINNEKFD